MAVFELSAATMTERQPNPCEQPRPMAQRAPPITALKRELDELRRLKEALVAAAIAAGQFVHRSLRRRLRG